MEICKKTELCTGCGLCSTVCPAGCIDMTENSEGFFYPQVREEQCLHCESCVKKCPVNRSGELVNPNGDERCFAFQNREEDVLRESSSGGFFTAAARAVLDSGGVVYAAEADGASHVRHVRIEREEELIGARKSKYLQSEAWGVYRSVRKDLAEGREVLFTGTPCQVAAVRSLTDSGALFTIDLLCHGVASRKVVDRYLDALSARRGKTIRSFQFRHKMNRGGVIIRSVFDDGSEYTANSLEDPFMRGYNNNLFLRRSCYACPFAGTARCGDVTIGDFWGLGVMRRTAIRTIDGVNFVKINSKQGQKLFDRILASQNVTVEEHSLAEAKLRNRTLTKPMRYTKRRVTFFEKLDSVRFDELVFGLTKHYEAERKRGELRDRVIRKAIKLTKGWE